MANNHTAKTRWDKGFMSDELDERDGCESKKNTKQCFSVRK